MPPDVYADLPRYRVKPGGWWFPLFFLLHGAAPGGVLFGLSLGGVLPGGAAGAVVGAVGGLLLLFAGAGLLIAFALRGKRAIETMRDAAHHGTWAGATVVGVESGLGNFRRRGFAVSNFSASKVHLHLYVQPPQGEPYELTQTTYLLSQERPAYHPGVQLWVRIHPEDPQVAFVPYPPPQPAMAAPPAPGLHSY